MPQDTKTDLLDLAETAVRNRGFDGFSYADLAAARGIRKASIHYHFPTKADLALALMTRYHARFETLLQELGQSDRVGARQLEGLVALYRSALNDGETLCLCVAFTASRESLSADLQGKISAFRTMMIDWIADALKLAANDAAIETNVPPKLEAQAILALLEGAHLAARAEANVAIFDRATASFLVRLKG